MIVHKPFLPAEVTLESHSDWQALTQLLRALQFQVLERAAPYGFPARLHLDYDLSALSVTLGVLRETEGNGTHGPQVNSPRLVRVK